jgi:recombination protein RecT
MTGRELKPYENALAKAADDFTKSASGLEYDKEKIFAMQALMKNEFSMATANKNPLSVRLAMLNVAATGLTLNPAYGYAFLVPRDGAIVLDISYKGLLKIATDTGSIVWGRADVVYEADDFEYNGPAKAPAHRANAFQDRGEIVGAYCIAKTCDGDILCDIISREELEKIRSKSDLYARKKSGPWLEWFSEMCCKAIIKRAQKTWPRSDRTSRLLDAIEIANAAEGGYTLDAAPVATVDDAQAASVQEWLDATGAAPREFLALFGVESVAAIPKFRYQEAITVLRTKGKANADI